VLSLLGAPVGDGTPELLQTTFPGTGERTVDVLARVAPGQLVHVECQTRPEPGMALRMLDYRFRIMQAHPKERLRQYVLVLGEGAIADYDDPEARFRSGFETIYLRERDPAELLTDPRLAPFAALAGDAASAKDSSDRGLAFDPRTRRAAHRRTAAPQHGAGRHPAGPQYD
jgi:hypothetical protein